jgi:hypothetical protein
MTDTTETNPSTASTAPKFTAEQIEMDCPDILQRIGDEIAVRAKKADKQIEQAENHAISVDKLIAQAQELCDDGGFNAFQKMFFPDLGKSRVYELLAIGTNKKSVEEIKASTRARVAKHRANKAAASVSVTVTEKSTPQTATAEAGVVQATRTTPVHISTPTKPMSLAKKMALVAFSATVRDLVRVTSDKRAERFAEASVTADDLAKLGKFFIDLANIKRSAAVKPAPIMALPDNGTVPAEQSAGNMKANTALRSKSQSGGVT